MFENEQDIQSTESITETQDFTPEIEAHEPSLLDKVNTGEVDFKDLDPATRKSVLNEWRSSLTDERLKYLSMNGWSDKHVFLGKDKNGNPIEWKTADEFERILKRPQVAKERESHLIEELRKRDAELEKLKNLTKFNAENALKKEEREIELKLKNARENFDTEALEAALEEKRSLEANKSQIQQYYQAPTPVQTANPLDNLLPEDRESFLSFKAELPMLGEDSALTQFVQKKWSEVESANSLSFQQKLDYIKKTTVTAFPSKFSKPTTNFMQTTNNINNNPIKAPSNKAAEVYAKLPDRDKAKIARLIESGKFANKEAVLKNFGLI